MCVWTIAPCHCWWWGSGHLECRTTHRHTHTRKYVRIVEPNEKEQWAERASGWLAWKQQPPQCSPHTHTHKQVYKHTQTHLQVFLLPALRARRSKQTGDYYPHMYFLLNIQWHTYTSAILRYALIFVVSSQFVFWFLNYITVVSAMVIISHIKGILHIFNGICYTLLLLLKVVVVTYS